MTLRVCWQCEHLIQELIIDCLKWYTCKMAMVRCTHWPCCCALAQSRTRLTRTPSRHALTAHNPDTCSVVDT